MEKLKNKILKLVRQDGKGISSKLCQVVSYDNNFLEIETQGSIEFIPIRSILRLELIKDFAKDGNALNEVRL